MTRDTLLIRLIGGLIVLRGGWALLNHSAMVLHRFDIANPMGFSGYMSELILNAPLALMVPLFGFSLAYIAAGILTLRQVWWAGAIYCLGFLIDAGVWVSMTTVNEYGAIYGGQASLVDMVFNLFDLAMLTCLAVWGYIHRPRRA